MLDLLTITDPEVLARAVRQLCWFLFWRFCPDAAQAWAQALFAQVVAVTGPLFAGATWHDAHTGLAQAWAIRVDDLLDLLDPGQAIRGDH